MKRLLLSAHARPDIQKQLTQVQTQVQTEAVNPEGNELSMTEVSRLPKPVAASWEWQQQGACRTLPTEMFFHPENERGPRRKAREMAAKAVCNTCPVIAECRAHALAVQEPYGIWGGLSEEERLEIISRSTRRGIYSVS